LPDPVPNPIPVYEYRQPALIDVFVVRNRRRVSGITSIGDELFIVSYESKYVDVYSETPMPFHRKRAITVPNLGSWPLGIASIPDDRLVFVSDYQNNSLHRVEVDSISTKRWPVAHGPVGLSIASSGNVIVVCSCVSVVQEYSGRGHLVRQVDLRDGLTGPWHAVQLADGRYAVSQQRGNTHLRHRVCLVSTTGNVERFFNGPDASDTAAGRPLSFPSGLAVGRDGKILVADRKNGRIVMIDPTSGSVREVVASGTGGLNELQVIHLDNVNRMYVADSTDNHVAVYEVYD